MTLLVRRLASEAPTGTLYGNVEIRQVDLSFNAEGTVIVMPKHEGDRVGEVIAELDPATYQSAATLAEARRDAAKAQLDLLLAGTRPEDIDQARANLANTQASLADPETTFARQKDLAAWGRRCSARKLVWPARPGVIMPAQSRGAIMPLNTGNKTFGGLAKTRAARTRRNKTATANCAVENELRRLDQTVKLAERVRPPQDRVLARPATGLDADKEFYDSLCGDP